MTELREPSKLDARAREEGMEVRSKVIALMTCSAFRDALESLVAGSSSFQLDLLPRVVTEPVLRDLTGDPGWSHESWLLNLGGDVSVAGSALFAAAPPALRFSRNECLRKPMVTAFAVRGFLSAVTSPEVRAAISAIAGSPLTFRSADIACYRQGDYLRRHQDMFDGRRFGLVWFFSRDWSAGCGGELVVEAPDGTAAVIAPRAGTVAGIRFAQACHHQVAAVSRPDWTRYSIASHFADAAHAFDALK